MTASWLVRHRWMLWRVGVEHREALMAQYMVFYGLTARPYLKNVFRELIGEFQNARILDGPLKLDRYAQTEIVDGKPVITINSLISRMPKVKDGPGIAHVAGWHESAHILVDVERRDLPPLTDLTSGLEVSTSSPFLCQAAQRGSGGWTVKEQALDAIALAASVADADLRRCVNYLNFLELAARGGDMGSLGWQLLNDVASVIGVNRTALRRYLEQHGICQFSNADGKARLIGTAPPFRGFVCLEPASATQRSVA